MYTLYWSPGGANMAPHAVLEETGAPHELRLVDFAKDEQRGTQYRRLNPNARVPTLIHDGKPIWESAAILLYLCERHPDAGLMPPVGTSEHGVFLQWIVYLTNTVQEELMHWWHADYYMDSEAGRDELKRVAERRLAEMLTRLDGVVAPYLLGERFSAADIYLVMLCRWTRAMAKPAVDWPNLRRCVDLVTARPAWQRMMQVEGITWTGRTAG